MFTIIQKDIKSSTLFQLCICGELDFLKHQKKKKPTKQPIHRLMTEAVVKIQLSSIKQNVKESGKT